MQSVDGQGLEPESANAPASQNTVIVCHECELSVAVPKLLHKQKAHCPRCGYVLTHFHESALDRIIAFSLTSLIFLVFAVPFKFLAFKAQGQGQSIDIPASILILIEQDYVALGLVQALAILIIPAVILLSLLYLTLPLKFGNVPPRSAWVFHTLFKLLPWGMAEIFLIGVLVSLIKISSMADIEMGFSFFAYLGFTVCMTLTFVYVDKHQLASRLNVDLHEHKAELPPAESIQRTWALLATSLVLYIPANVLPIMNTRMLGQDEPSTILGGVILLWQMGSYPIALVIFIASVFVPVGKLVILAWLNYSVQAGFQVATTERIFWYRVTEFIGRWSMVDVFVVAILVSLIQLGNTMSIYPGPAALAFCGVVILTMLAAMTFDTKLIWDIRESKNER